LDVDQCAKGCWQCNCSSSCLALNLPVAKENLKRTLIDIFIHNGGKVPETALSPKGLVTSMESYKDTFGITFNELIFGKCRNTNIAGSECRSLVLRLFAARILEPAVDDDKHLYCKLAMDETATYNFNRDESFEGFQFIFPINRPALKLILVGMFGSTTLISLHSLFSQWMSYKNSDGKGFHETVLGRFCPLTASKECRCIFKRLHKAAILFPIHRRNDDDLYKMNDQVSFDKLGFLSMDEIDNTND
jgi:hypothetical protein